MKKSSYRDLEIYKLAHDLAVEIHKFTLNLPKYELFEAGSQLRRSSKSISANIVEGYGRRQYKTEFIRFLVITQASCDESIEWVIYNHDCHDVFRKQAKEILQRLNKLGRKINRFIAAVEKNHLIPKNIEPCENN